LSSAWLRTWGWPRQSAACWTRAAVSTATLHLKGLARSAPTVIKPWLPQMTALRVPRTFTMASPNSVLFVVIGMSFIGHQVLSWRGAEGDRRQQLKWLACGGAVAAASLILAAVLGMAGLLAGLAAVPVSIGVGILRYRLYDIDRIISRTLAYVLVTGVLAGVYAGLVLLATQVFGFHAPVAVAAATLAAAALFNPLRVRVQRVVDRRFNRAG